MVKYSIEVASNLPPQQAGLKYRLATTVPGNWIPLVPAAVSTDTIHLRNGTKIDGKVIAQETARVKVKLEASEMWIDRDDIDRIEKKRMRLNRSRMLRNETDVDPTPIPMLSRLLGTWRDPLLWLKKYSVPRAGMRFLLRKQRVRDSRVGTSAWLGKKVLTRRGEGSSGLKFDYVSNAG